MSKGKCIKWFAERGYGFIQPDDGSAEILVNRAGLVNRVDRLQVDQRVAFEIELNRAGKPQARQVAILGFVPQVQNSLSSSKRVRRASPTPTLRETAEALFRQVK
jgi:cold shock CspA family protein